MPLEVPREQWEYRLLIRLPDFVTNKEVQQAIETTVVKKKMLLAQEITLFDMNEGKSVQIMHTGPFTTEATTLKKMNDFMKEKNLSLNGLHHEIYLTDFRRTAPDKLKTILREPVK